MCMMCESFLECILIFRYTIFQAYCKFSNVPIKFVASNDPWQSPTGELPILHHEEGTTAQVGEIFNYLRKQVSTVWSI